MMMVRVAYFPQHFAIPVGFQDDAAFEREAAEEALLRRAPVVEQRPTLGEIAGQARRVRHGPGVGDLTLNIDEIHVAVFDEVRSKQRISRKDALRLARAQPNAPSFESVLLDGCHERVTSRGAACSKCGKAGEQPTALPGAWLLIDHRNASLRSVR